ncbi:phosphotransferase [Paenibacillus borealis]|uniref:Aminoglycoside phosphotransferase n=1 Tax=Paenibacillus borealis TaxID=160799 RepID=A0A089LBP8_PAEBO|nr:phosphotransferase [Paenibacillus borealis]AIQ58252.1 aminoglycoside phosphotransferase [Paenibacillus borealis]
MGKVFGTGYSVAMVTKMHGGAQKVVYKIDCTNGFSCVLYVWDITMNYFQEEIANQYTNAQSYGSELFEINNRYLTGHSIRTPILYDLNKERNHYNFDYALVEYVAGQDAEAYFNHPDARVKDTIFQRLGDMITGMHAGESGIYGKPNQAESNTEQCHLLQFENAKIQLSYASEYIDVIRENQGKLLDMLHNLESQIEPRSRYGYIHGELGPNHVLVTDHLEPCLIDIEGAEFYDIEHEHSFMEFRFGDFYRYLKNDHLDVNRKLFYQYHHHLSLISAGLKLVQRGYPDQQTAKGISDYHTRRALQFIEDVTEN